MANATAFKAKVVKDNGGKVKDANELADLLKKDPAMVTFDLSNPGKGAQAGAPNTPGDRLPKNTVIDVDGIKAKVTVNNKGVPTVT
jgi:hypothetical protein